MIVVFLLFYQELLLWILSFVVGWPVVKFPSLLTWTEIFKAVDCFINLLNCKVNPQDWYYKPQIEPEKKLWSYHWYLTSVWSINPEWRSPPRIFPAICLTERFSSWNGRKQTFKLSVSEVIIIYIGLFTYLTLDVSFERLLKYMSVEPRNKPEVVVYVLEKIKHLVINHYSVP